MRCVWGAAPLKSWSVGTLFGARVSHGWLGCIWRVHLSRFHQTNFWGNWDWGIYKILQLSCICIPNRERRDFLPSGFSLFVKARFDPRPINRGYPPATDSCPRPAAPSTPAAPRIPTPPRSAGSHWTPPRFTSCSSEERGTQRHKGGISRPPSRIHDFGFNLFRRGNLPFFFFFGL